MPENQLFVCEYGYILYKVLIRALLDPQTKIRDDLIITDATQDLKPMYNVIKDSGLFRNVYFLDCTPYRDYYKLLYCQYPQNTALKHLFVLANYLKMSINQYKFKEIDIGFSIDFNEYKEIYCSDHPYVINGYLANHKTPYIIIEHARNVYRNLTKPYDLFFTVLNTLDRIYIMKGLRCASRYCKAVEVNESSGLAKCLKFKSTIEWNVEEQINRLNTIQKDYMFKIYSQAYGLNLDYSKTYNVLLTNQLYSNAFVSSEKSQIQFYKDVIKEHFTNDITLIKPHPKDTIDYKKWFPECITVSSDITSEVLNFCNDLNINKALTLYSTSAYSFTKKAKKVIILENTENSSQMESLRRYQ